MVNEITQQEGIKITKNKEPKGLFYYIFPLGDLDYYVGINNSKGKAITGIFKTKDECINWLIGKSI